VADKKEKEPTTEERLAEAEEQGYIGETTEEGKQAGRYADLSNDEGYMGGPPKGEIVAE